VVECTVGGFLILKQIIDALITICLYFILKILPI
jgi:hypothetical protein